MTTTHSQRAPERLNAITATGPAPRVAAIIITWNRKQDVQIVLNALSKQLYPIERLDVIVIDNASTDGTSEELIERFNPDRVVDNPTDHAHEPAFDIHDDRGPNSLGFSSLTLVRNTQNHGGCGGFNTGFQTVEHVLADSPTPPDFIWLVDDDIDLPEDTLVQLVHTTVEKPDAALVGSRTCDINDRWRTIETTIYFDRETGIMRDNTPPHDPRHADHAEWAKQVGGPKNGSGYEGIRQVDVVSACSLLARWSDVKEVGYWDKRYFIYCDDADWCLRFARAGKEVWLNLDAVVFHTPWHHKLTPARLYYAQRNLLWMIEKALDPPQLRAVWTKRANHYLRESRRAMIHQRYAHAEIMRRSVADAIRWRTGEGGGKLDDTSPPRKPLAEQLERAGVKSRARIALLIPSFDAFEHAKRFQSRLEELGIKDLQTTEFIRNDTGVDPLPESAPVRRVFYSKRKLSKIRRQLPLLIKPPRIQVVFDQHCDAPILLGRWVLHIDGAKPNDATLERRSIPTRFGFAARWLITAFRAKCRAANLATFTSSDRFG